MRNVLITGPAGSGKSALARHYAQSRPNVFSFDHTTVEIHIPKPPRATPSNSVLLFDECAESVLRDYQPDIVRFIETDGRVVLVAKAFSGVPLWLLMPHMMSNGGLRDIAMAAFEDGRDSQIATHRETAPPVKLISTERHAA